MKALRPQSFENHTQHDVAFYSYSIGVIIFAVIMGYGLHTVNKTIPLHGLQYIAPIFFAVLFSFILLKVRGYATTLQDRIIRQEVQFRYYVATGTLLPDPVTLRHMIALRFAGDNEFTALVDKVVSNPSQTSKEIKHQIKNWKSDHARV